MPFTVTYNGNGSDGGSPPTDPNSPYAAGAQVTVLPAGLMTRSGDVFAYWNTANDGSGSVYGPNATFSMPSANVTLYAQWYTTQGLSNLYNLGAGVTPHYTFSYDSSLTEEPARTNLVIAACESDFNIMSSNTGWFGNLQLSPKITTPFPMRVANLSGGAGTGGTYPNISTTLKSGSGNAAYIRYLIVSEMTEVLMYVQAQGWSAPNGSNEQSCGEGLSRFLAQQFLVAAGLGTSQPGYAISPSWLNSSLPPTNPSSTQLAGQYGGYRTYLTANIDTSVTSIPVTTAVTIPFLSAFVIQIDNEQMLVSGANTATNTLTVTRGYNGTAKAAHTAATAAQQQAGTFNVFQNYGSRADYVNTTLEYDHGIDAATGCAMLFLYYLNVQLGFSINAIVAAAPGLSNAANCLRGVYQNLTGDNSDPFPYFNQLLGNAFPPDQVSNIPGPNPDNPWPLGSLTFWGVKNTYGSNEVSDILATGGVYPNGFSLALEGFNAQVVGSALPATPTIAFGGVTAQISSPKITYQFTNPKIPQRILFNYDVHFANPVGPFPAAGETAVAGAASITVLGQKFPASTEFFFLAGADPYFTNVQPNPLEPSNAEVPWLSQDLRVFTATPGQPGNSVPVPAPQYVAPAQFPAPPGTPPSFIENNAYGTYNIQGAYKYITQLIGYLNGAYGDPTKADPFDPSNSILPGQLTAYTGDSSVTPGTKANGTIYNNYNFAIARVRLRGTAGPSGAAPGVKVFFRLWQTQTADTDWNPGYTYLSDDVTGINPQYPKAPPDNHTIPFFASDNYPVLTDTPNIQPITIQQGDSQWAYFGCFLNLYDTTFVVNSQNVQQLFAQGTHHCLVAEIAYTPSPIQNVGTVVETTENSDLLAQRNLQVSESANPGTPATHRIPQTFDVRPTAPGAGGGGTSSHPDELMINWGNTPVGCLASVYWPGANAADVVSTASRLYGAQVLSVADSHTIQCQTSRGVTYVPIPVGTDESLAGLLTIDLPATVLKGQEFNLVLRRIGTRQIGVVAPPPPSPAPNLQVAASTTRAAAKIGKKPAAVLKGAVPAAVAVVSPEVNTERYVVGSFQVKIPSKPRRQCFPLRRQRLRS